MGQKKGTSPSSIYRLSNEVIIRFRTIEYTGDLKDELDNTFGMS